LIEVAPTSGIDTWEWVSGHKGPIPTWAKELIPQEYHNSNYIGKVF
jgi:hypothetical protein